MFALFTSAITKLQENFLWEDKGKLLQKRALFFLQAGQQRLVDRIYAMSSEEHLFYAHMIHTLSKSLIVHELFLEQLESSFETHTLTHLLLGMAGAPGEGPLDNDLFLAVVPVLSSVIHEGGLVLYSHPTLMEAFQRLDKAFYLEGTRLLHEREDEETEKSEDQDVHLVEVTSVDGRKRPPSSLSQSQSDDHNGQLNEFKLDSDGSIKAGSKNAVTEITKTVSFCTSGTVRSEGVFHSTEGNGPLESPGLRTSSTSRDSLNTTARSNEWEIEQALKQAFLVHSKSVKKLKLLRVEGRDGYKCIARTEVDLSHNLIEGTTDGLELKSFEYCVNRPTTIEREQAFCSTLPNHHTDSEYGADPALREYLVKDLKKRYIMVEEEGLLSAPLAADESTCWQVDHGGRAMMEDMGATEEECVVTDMQASPDLTEDPEKGRQEMVIGKYHLLEAQKWQQATPILYVNQRSNAIPNRPPQPPPSSSWCWKRRLESVADVLHYVKTASQATLEELDSECQETICHAVASVYSAETAVNVIQILNNNVSPTLFEVQDRHGNTPLHNAVTAGDLIVAQEFMILHPSAMCKINHEGNTPLDIAVDHRNDEIVDYLLRGCVSSDPHNTATVRLLESSLPTAMKNGYIHFLNIVLELHSRYSLAIDFESTDSHDHTAWHYLSQAAPTVRATVAERLWNSSLSQSLVGRLVKALGINRSSPLSIVHSRASTHVILHPSSSVDTPLLEGLLCSDMAVEDSAVGSDEAFGPESECDEVSLSGELVQEEVSHSASPTLPTSFGNKAENGADSTTEVNVMLESSTQQTLTNEGGVMEPTSTSQSTEEANLMQDCLKQIESTGAIEEALLLGEETTRQVKLSSPRMKDSRTVSESKSTQVRRRSKLGRRTPRMNRRNKCNRRGITSWRKSAKKSVLKRAQVDALKKVLEHRQGPERCDEEARGRKPRKSTHLRITPNMVKPLPQTHKEQQHCEGSVADGADRPSLSTGSQAWTPPTSESSTGVTVLEFANTSNPLDVICTHMRKFGTCCSRHDIRNVLTIGTTFPASEAFGPKRRYSTIKDLKCNPGHSQFYFTQQLSAQSANKRRQCKSSESLQANFDQQKQDRDCQPPHILPPRETLTPLATASSYPCLSSSKLSPQPSSHAHCKLSGDSNQTALETSTEIVCHTHPEPNRRQSAAATTHGLPLTVPEDHRQRLQTAAELLHAQDYTLILQLSYDSDSPQSLPPELRIPYIFITGLAYYKLYNHKKSVQCFTECLRLADKCCRKGDITICNIYLGDIEFARSHYIEAAGAYQRALESYCRESAMAVDFRMVMPTKSAVWLKCGSAFKNASQVESAVAAYKKAVKLASSKKDELSAHTSLGNLYQGIGENKRAVVEYEASIELARELQDNISLGLNHGNLGNALLGLHQGDKALHHLHKALDVAVEYETTPQAIGRAYNNLGTAYHSLNEHTKAEEHYDLALAQAIFGNDIPGQARAYQNIGNLRKLNLQFRSQERMVIQSKDYSYSELEFSDDNSSLAEAFVEDSDTTTTDTSMPIYPSASQPCLLPGWKLRPSKRHTVRKRQTLGRRHQAKATIQSRFFRLCSTIDIEKWVYSTLSRGGVYHHMRSAICKRLFNIFVLSQLKRKRLTAKEKKTAHAILRFLKTNKKPVSEGAGKNRKEVMESNKQKTQSDKKLNKVQEYKKQNGSIQKVTSGKATSDDSACAVSELTRGSYDSLGREPAQEPSYNSLLSNTGDEAGTTAEVSEVLETSTEPALAEVKVKSNSSSHSESLPQPNPEQENLVEMLPANQTSSVERPPPTEEKTETAVAAVDIKSNLDMEKYLCALVGYMLGAHLQQAQLEHVVTAVTRALRFLPAQVTSAESSPTATTATTTTTTCTDSSNPSLEFGKQECKPFLLPSSEVDQRSCDVDSPITQSSSHHSQSDSIPVPCSNTGLNESYKVVFRQSKPVLFPKNERDALTQTIAETATEIGFHHTTTENSQLHPPATGHTHQVESSAVQKEEPDLEVSSASLSGSSAVLTFKSTSIPVVVKGTKCAVKKAQNSQQHDAQPAGGQLSEEEPGKNLTAESASLSSKVQMMEPFPQATEHYARPTEVEPKPTHPPSSMKEGEKATECVPKLKALSSEFKSPNSVAPPTSSEPAQQPASSTIAMHALVQTDQPLAAMKVLEINIGAGSCTSVEKQQPLSSTSSESSNVLLSAKKKRRRRRHLVYAESYSNASLSSQSKLCQKLPISERRRQQREVAKQRYSFQRPASSSDSDTTECCKRRRLKPRETGRAHYKSCSYSECETSSTEQTRAESSAAEESMPDHNTRQPTCPSPSQIYGTPAALTLSLSALAKVVTSQKHSAQGYEQKLKGEQEKESTNRSVSLPKSAETLEPFQTTDHDVRSGNEEPKLNTVHCLQSSADEEESVPIAEASIQGESPASLPPPSSPASAEKPGSSTNAAHPEPPSPLQNTTGTSSEAKRCTGSESTDSSLSYTTAREDNIPRKNRPQSYHTQPFTDSATATSTQPHALLQKSPVSKERKRQREIAEQRLCIQRPASASDSDTSEHYRRRQWRRRTSMGACSMNHCYSEHDSSPMSSDKSWAADSTADEEPSTESVTALSSEPSWEEQTLPSAKRRKKEGQAEQQQQQTSHTQEVGQQDEDSWPYSSSKLYTAGTEPSGTCEERESEGNLVLSSCSPYTASAQTGNSYSNGGELVIQPYTTPPRHISGKAAITEKPKVIYIDMHSQNGNSPTEFGDAVAPYILPTKFVVGTDAQNVELETFICHQRSLRPRSYFQVIPHLPGMSEPDIPCRIILSECFGNHTCIVAIPTIPSFTINGNLYSFSDLTRATEEANHLQQLFKCTALVHKHATKQAVLERLLHAKIVHIATHTCGGCLVFSDQRLLSPSEIENLDFRDGPPALVVLICCFSGNTVHGLEGIAFAFLKAGVPTVIAVLGRIEDDVALEFTKCFYHNMLERGMCATEALHAAEVETYSFGSSHCFVLFGRELLVVH